MDGKFLRLVAPQVSGETVETLEYLLHEAKAGRIAGIAYVAMHKVNDYTLDATGTMLLFSALTRGMLLELDDELSKIEPKQA